MQVRETRPVTQSLVDFDYSIIRRARDRQDGTTETGQWRRCAECVLAATTTKKGTVELPDGRDRSGAAGERERSGGTGV